MDLNQAKANARKAREEETTLRFGGVLADLEVFLEGKAPAAVKLEVVGMLESLATKLNKADYKSDEEGMHAAFGGDLVRVGTAQLSEMAMMALDSVKEAAIKAGVVPPGTTLEQFVTGLAGSLATMQNNLQDFANENTGLKDRLKLLEEQVKTGGDKHDPDSWAAKAEELKEAQRVIKGLEDTVAKSCGVFGVDPKSKTANEVAREMATAKAALIATADPAVIKAAEDAAAKAATDAAKAKIDALEAKVKALAAGYAYIEAHEGELVGPKLGGRSSMGGLYAQLPEDVRKGITDARK